jgi:hypothetical protein
VRHAIALQGIFPCCLFADTRFLVSPDARVLVILKQEKTHETNRYCADPYVRSVCLRVCGRHPDRGHRVAIATADRNAERQQQRCDNDSFDPRYFASLKDSGTTRASAILLKRER